MLLRTGKDVYLRLALIVLEVGVEVTAASRSRSILLSIPEIAPIFRLTCRFCATSPHFGPSEGCAPLGAPPHSPPGSPVHSPVDPPVDPLPHSPVHSPVGSPVDPPVDSLPRSPVHSPVGSPVHSPVDSPPRSPVHSPVDSGVKALWGPLLTSERREPRSLSRRGTRFPRHSA